MNQNHKSSVTTGSKLMSAALALSLVLAPSSWAVDAAVTGSTSQASNSNVSASEFQSQAVGQIEAAKLRAQSLQAADAAQSGAKGDPCKGVTNENQKAEYCTAAKQADSAKNGAMIGMGIWGAAGALCAYVCAMSFTPAGVSPGLQKACSIGTIGAALGDAAVNMMMTKDMSSAMTGMTGAMPGMMGLMNGGGGQAAANAAGQSAIASGQAGTTTLANGSVVTLGEGGVGSVSLPAGQAGPPAPVDASGAANAVDGQAVQGNQNDYMACMGAAMALMQVGMKAMTMNSAKDAKQSALANASQLQKNTTVDVPALGVSSANRSAAISGGNSPSAATSLATGTTGSGNCMNQSSGGVTAVISCARASNPDLPPFAQGQEFADQYKKLTGQDLTAYLNSLNENTTSGQAFLGAMGPAGQLASVSGPIGDAALKVDGELRSSAALAGGVYQSSGGGGARKPANKDTSLEQMMAQMMGTLTGKDGAKKDDPFIAGEMVYGRIARANPERLIEDRTVSLFDRVSYRYYVSSRKGDVQQLPWASIYNRAVASQMGIPQTQAPAAPQPMNPYRK